MRMKTKVLLIITVVAIVCVLTLYTVGQVILMGGYEQIENVEVRDHVETALSVLSNEFTDLSSTTADYAAWDDTYNFVQDANHAYIDTNLVDSTFENLRVDVIVYTNTQGDVIFAKAYDRQNSTETRVPSSLLELVAAKAQLWNYSEVDGGLDGIISLSEGPMLITSRPILTSQNEGPVHGALIMGRWLDSSEIDFITRTTHIGFSVGYYRNPSDAEFQAASAQLSEEKPFLVRPLSEQEVAGYALVEDIFGQPYLIFEVPIPRDVYQQGQTSTAYFTLACVAMETVLTIVLFTVLQKSMLSQVDRLTKDVRDLGKNKDIQEHLSWKRTDELSILAEAIDSMMDQRLKAIEELAAMVGHDLRNPLTGISSATYYLKSKVKPEPGSRMEEMFRVINKDIEYSNKIVNDLLDYSRKIRVEFTDTNLKELLKESLALVNIPSNTQVTVSAEEDLNVRVDPDKLKRVFVNILKNSTEAMATGGTLMIKAKTAKDKIKIMFSDTGPGIPKETLEKLFTPLFTTKPKGMGLGLAICKRLVEAHGGTITAESTPRKGTTFTVTIPTKPVVDESENA
jgi:signal transduction histidine kinase